MNFGNTIRIGWRVVALTLLQTLIFIVTAMSFQVGRAEPGRADTEAVASREMTVEVSAAQDAASLPREQGSAALWLLLSIFLQVAVWSFVILRSCRHGWRLCATVFVVFFGLTGVLSQIEMIVFVPRAFSTGVGGRMALVNLATCASFAVVAVTFFGRWRAGATVVESAMPIRFSPTSWVWRLAVAACAYVVLYLTFGYLLIWQNPLARDFYASMGVGSSSGGTTITNTMSSLAAIVLLQVGRSFLFVALAIPILRMTTGGRAAGALAVALLFGVVFPAQLLVPNPWMPDIVRYLHLVETGVSTFIFGLIVWALFGGSSRRRFDAELPVQANSLDQLPV